MGTVHIIRGADAAPTFAHAGEAWLMAHTAPGAWSSGTAVKYRQTLSALGIRLGDTSAVLDTPDGAAELLEAFTARRFATGARDPGPAPVHPAIGAVGWRDLMLLARSRDASIRSLERYGRPGPKPSPPAPPPDDTPGEPARRIRLPHDTTDQHRIPFHSQ
jgi:hypothetical protein